MNTTAFHDPEVGPCFGSDSREERIGIGLRCLRKRGRPSESVFKDMSNRWFAVEMQDDENVILDHGDDDDDDDGDVGVSEERKKEAGGEM